jgi:hypothetical protein
VTASMMADVTALSKDISTADCAAAKMVASSAAM